MKTIIRYTGLMILMCLFNSAFGDVEISPSIKKQISEILIKPRMVYRLNIREETKSNAHIDNWANQYINLKSADKRVSGQRISYFREMTKNGGIFLDGHYGPGVQPEQAFKMYYIQKPNSRRFAKMIDAPSKNRLADNKAVQIGQTFIKNNKFCLFLPEDKPGYPMIHFKKRKIISLENREEDETWNLLQRVEFRRIFKGMKVMNARQVVHIHPDTEEILAYKMTSWSPVETKSGKFKPYIAYDEVIEQIKTAYKDQKIAYEVDSVEACWYQDLEKLFPVLVVIVRTKSADVQETIHKDLIILLVKGLELKLGDEDRGEIREPMEDNYKE